MADDYGTRLERLEAASGLNIPQFKFIHAFDSSERPYDRVTPWHYDCKEHELIVRGGNESLEQLCQRVRDTWGIKPNVELRFIHYVYWDSERLAGHPNAAYEAIGANCAAKHNVDKPV